MVNNRTYYVGKSGGRKGDGISLIQGVYIVLIWALPILGAWYSYRKMGEVNQIELIKEIKLPLSILGITPIFIGLLVFLTGSDSASGVKVLHRLGIGLMLFGWFGL